jgi:hypothetical protein
MNPVAQTIPLYVLLITKVNYGSKISSRDPANQDSLRRLQWLRWTHALCGFSRERTDVVLPSDYSAPRIQFLGPNKLIEASYLKGSSS